MAIKFLQNVEVDGEVQGTSLDINGSGDVSGTLTVDRLDVAEYVYHEDDNTYIRFLPDRIIAVASNNTVLNLNVGADTIEFGHTGKPTTLQGSSLAFTGAATFNSTIGSGAITSTGKITGTELEGTSLDINGSADIAGNLQVTQNAATLNLVGTNHSYIQWFPDGISAGRKAYTGYGGATDNNFSIVNEISGGNVKINTNGGTIELQDNTVVTGELEATSLDINGNADISGNLTGVDSITASATVQAEHLYTTDDLVVDDDATISGDLTVSGVTYGAYHSVVDDQYYFDDYNGSRNLAFFYKNARADIIRYQSVDNFEYWNGSAWVADASQESNVEKLLDGRQDTSWSVPSTYYKFRFTTEATTSWPTMAMIWMQTSWSGSTYPGATMTVEEYDGSSWATKVTAEFTSTNGNTNWGLHSRADTALHTGNGSSADTTRITIDFYGWSPSNGSYTTIPLQNLMITSNYAGTENTDYTNLLSHDTHLRLGDSRKLILGAGDDLTFEHDGSNSFIRDMGTGDLYIEGTQNVFIRDRSSGNVWFQGNQGGVNLRYQDSTKISTTNTGVTVTGDVGATTVTASGEVQGGSLDINGNADISGTTVCNNTVTIVAGAPKLILKDNSDDDDQAILFRNSSDNDDYKIATADFTSAATGDGLFIGSESSDPVALVTNDTTALTLDTSQNATFAGDISLSGGSIKNTTGTFVMINNAGAQFDIKSNQGVRLYIDKNNDDTAHKFEILANTATYASNNVVSSVDQSGNATFAGSVTATSLDINGDGDVSGTLTIGTISATNYGLASGDIPNNAADTTGNAATATTAGTVTTAAQGNITSVGTLTGLTVSGDLNVAGGIVHTGDPDTTIMFTTNSVRVTTGGTARLTAASTGVNIGKRDFNLSGGTAGGGEGDVVYFGDGESLTPGSIYYYNGDSWQLADASAASSSKGMLAVALGEESSSGMLIRGMATLVADPGAAGDVLFLSETAGRATATAPTTSQAVVRVVGYCLHATNAQIWFNPDGAFIEVS